MRRSQNVLAAAVLGALSLLVARTAPVDAQAAMQTPSAQAVKAAADATRAAQKITLETRHGSGVGGSVGLTEIGRSRTRITVRLPASGKYRVMMYPGSDCNDNRAASAAAVALSPTNFNRTSASSSSTILSLPIQQVRSNYVVDVRDANNRAAATAACARLNR